MNVLITGGTGYIGSHTAVELLEHGHEVIIVDNLCNSSKEVVKKITFFINNEPVKVDNCDYCEINTTTDKMTVFDVCIDVSEYKELCSFYAVAATSGEDYLIQDDTTQSERCLLINK